MGKFQSQILGAAQSATQFAFGTAIAGQQFEQGVKSAAEGLKSSIEEDTTDIPAPDFKEYVKGEDGYINDEDIADTLQEKIPEGGFSQADYIRAYGTIIADSQKRMIDDFAQQIISNYRHLKIGIQGGKKHGK